MVKQFLQNFLLGIIGIFFALCLSEALLSLEILQPQPLVAGGSVDVRELARRSALRRGVNFDERSLREVIEESKTNNPRSFPAISPAYFLSSGGGSLLTIDGKPVVPLGIASNADNYYCNESGVYEKFETDQYGFRNPATVWDGAVDILAIGDSFTLGSCLSEADSIIGNLRRNYKIVNLGQGANGPLIELAGLQEFAAFVKPRLILWNFFPNDLTDDLERDRQNTILNEYLNPNFSQHLFDRNQNIQKAVDSVVEDYWRRVSQRSMLKEDNNYQHIWSFPRLTALYKSLRVGVAINQTKKKPDIQLFLQIISSASKKAAALNASFLFVYLPDCNNYSYGQNTWKNELINAIQLMGVDVFDAEPIILELKESRNEPFYYCPGSHYSPHGAKAVADGIQRKLNSMFPKVIKINKLDF